jgi:two-component system sensor histidine kinase AlgZ
MNPSENVDLCQPALALRALLAAQAVVGAAVMLGAAPGQWGALQATAAFGCLVAMLAWLGGLCLGRAALARRSALARLVLATSWAAVCALAGLAGVAWAGLVEASLRVTAGTALSGALAAAFFWSWLEQRRRLWQPAQASARLAQLQSRIRPHFLFNALNTALALVRVDPDRAEGVLEDLSALFREALAEDGPAVSLHDEIELARRYLAIEQLRFGERLRISWDIDERAAAARVPPLVLQPLVENAVRHGVEPAPAGGELAISTKLRQGLAVIEVSNSLPDAPSRPGSGMALANVAERLKLMHDMAADCEAWREERPGGARFRARLTVPL